MSPTGWQNHMLQDMDSRLHRWFASRLDAMWILRSNFSKVKT
jgi:hypothetical protein